MMKVTEFIEKLKKALNSNTVYCTGMFGNPITPENIEQKAKQYPQKYNAQKQATLNSLVGKNYFGFDCVCLVKGILWGWDAKSTETYGGAKYNSNNVPDVSTEGILTHCTDISEDFSNIIPGEIVWMTGHVGVYIGDNQVIECTAKWDNNVLLSTLGNNGATGTRVRSWKKHAKMSKWIDYAAATPTPAKKSNTEIAQEVISGKWGNGTERKTKLIQAGYDYDAIQKEVDRIINGNKSTTPTPQPAPTPIVTKPTRVAQSGKSVQDFLNTYYGDNIKKVTGKLLTIDGSLGSHSKKAIVIAMQTELNKLDKALAIDGSFGSKTAKTFTNKVGELRFGSKGTFVLLWQMLVFAYGYNPNGLDSSFGNGCTKATNTLFKAKGIPARSVVTGDYINKLI